RIRWTWPRVRGHAPWKLPPLYARNSPAAFPWPSDAAQNAWRGRVCHGGASATSLIAAKACAEARPTDWPLTLQAEGRGSHGGTAVTPRSIPQSAHLVVEALLRAHHERETLAHLGPTQSGQSPGTAPPDAIAAAP